MTHARRYYSWNGSKNDLIEARDIKSYWSAAYHIGPFVDEWGRRPVCWVGWGTRGNHRKIPPYFRYWPKVRQTSGQTVLVRKKTGGESPLHLKAKLLCVQILLELLRLNQSLFWGFLDPEVSSFPLTGDLLSGVREVRKEHEILTLFGNTYRFDVALLASPHGPILAAIEFELENRVPARKLAVCKAMGFPLITISLQDLSEKEITREWLLTTLTETTRSNDEGRRRNFFHVHSLLYPTYLDIPAWVRKNERQHQYLVFASDKDLEILTKKLLSLRVKLRLSKRNADFHLHQSHNEETQRELAQEGAMAGHDWASYNDHRYLGISLDVPVEKRGAIYLFHLILASWLTSRIECLVGYKFTTEAWNLEPFNPLWYYRGPNNTGKYVDYKIGLKHLSYPLRYLKEYVKLVEADQKQPPPLDLPPPSWE